MKDWSATVKRLRAIPGYKAPFARVFGDDDSVTDDNAAKAIAAYERTLITPDSPYDRYVKGNKARSTRNSCAACSASRRPAAPPATRAPRSTG